MADQGELEGTAQMILTHAGEDGDDAPDIGKLARTVGPVVYARALRGHAEVARVGQEWRIYVRRGLPPAYRRFAIAHEIAEFWLLRERHLGDRIEHDANYVAAAMLTPRRAFLRAIREGLDRVALADEFGITQSHAVLREAELSGRPRALVTPQKVYLRGEGQWDESDARRQARKPGPGVCKTSLTDDPRRVVLDPAVGDDEF